MKIQLLPSTIENGIASSRQHLSCFVIDDVLAVDAGSLSMSANAAQQDGIRDVLLTHAHIDHIAGLPLFIDDHFSELKTPVKVHASEDVIEVLQKHIFNWKVYPDFSELQNSYGRVLEYRPFEPEKEFKIGKLSIRAIPVNHKVPSHGFVIRSENSAIALTGDTAEAKHFWSSIESIDDLAAVFVECAFPDELSDLAEISHHLTPGKLLKELALLSSRIPKVYVINIKPVFRDKTVAEITALGIENLEIFEVGKVYEI